MNPGGLKIIFLDILNKAKCCVYSEEPSQTKHMLCVLKHGQNFWFPGKFFFKSVDKLGSCRQGVNIFCIIRRLTLCLQGNLFGHLLIFFQNHFFLKFFKGSHIKYCETV